jgi:DNA invertase Pin-like site-specific DNA recombinase
MGKAEMIAKKHVAIYTRVSTDHQTTENQERELREIARRMGWTIVKVYKDEGISGAKSRTDRPAFDAMCKDAARRRFEMVMAWSVDRLGRSLQDLVTLLSELHALEIDLFLHQQGVDTTTPAGKALFQMMGVFAEFERAIIRERVKSGLERAKAQGTRLGRRPIDADKEAAIRADLAAGAAGIIKLAKVHGVGVGTVQRIKAALIAAP